MKDVASVAKRIVSLPAAALGGACIGKLQQCKKLDGLVISWSDGQCKTTGLSMTNSSPDDEFTANVLDGFATTLVELEQECSREVSEVEPHDKSEPLEWAEFCLLWEMSQLHSLLECSHPSVPIA